MMCAGKAAVPFRHSAEAGCEMGLGNSLDSDDQKRAISFCRFISTNQVLKSPALSLIMAANMMLV